MMLEEELKIRAYKAAIKEMLLEDEQFGLMKGQSVSRHVRKDPRTGKSFVAGQGGSGSPEKVLAEKKTVSGGKIGENLKNPLLGTGDSIGIQRAPPESSVLNPDVLETLIRNFENATIDELREITNDVFKQPRSRDRGYMAELLLKEVMRRQIIEKEEMDRMKEDVKKEKQAQKEKEKQGDKNGE